LDYQSLMTFVGAIVTLGTALHIVQKIVRNWRKAKEESSAKILQAAKEEISLAKMKLEARIKDVESDLENLRISLSKDLEHAKEQYSIELKNLGEKIEETRKELRYHHTQILQLLTKMVEDRE
jgi:chromosome segregation ATPase